MHIRFLINLDLLSFSLLNLLFFMIFYLIFQDSSTFTTKSCSELPRPCQLIEYTHLAVAVIFMLAFLLKSCMFTLENEDKCGVKLMKCMINLSLFTSFLVFNVFLLNLFYIYYQRDEDCLVLNKTVLADFIVISLGYAVLIVYRLCFKAILNQGGLEKEWRKGGTMHMSQIEKKKRGSTGKYGTMPDYDQDF